MFGLGIFFAFSAPPIYVCQLREMIEMGKRRGALLPVVSLGLLGAHGQIVETRETQRASANQHEATVGHISVPPSGSNSIRNTRAYKTVGLQPRPVPSINLLGSIATASPEESFALNWDLVYIRDDKEISVVDITHPASLQIKATALSSVIQNSGLIHYETSDCYLVT